MPIPWDGGSLRPGPIALAVGPPRPNAEPDGFALFAASATSGGVVGVPLSRIGEFLRGHDREFFISADGAAAHRQLLDALDARCGGRRDHEVLWDLTRAGRWVDLCLLDRQVRCAEGDNNFTVRAWAEIIADRSDVGADQVKHPALTQASGLQTV